MSDVYIEFLGDGEAEVVSVEQTEVVEVEIRTPAASIKIDDAEFIEVGSSWISVRSTLIELPFTMGGPLQVKVGEGHYPVHTLSYVVTGIAAVVATAPGGQDIILDVIKNDVDSLFLTPGDRPTIDPGQTDAVVGAWDTDPLVPGDQLSVNVVQVGSGGTPGEELVLTLTLELAP